MTDEARKPLSAKLKVAAGEMHPLRQLRKSLRMKQTEMAAALGVSQAAICKWERGGNIATETINMINQYAVCRGAKFDIMWFFRGPRDWLVLKK